MIERSRSVAAARSTKPPRRLTILMVALAVPLGLAAFGTGRSSSAATFTAASRSASTRAADGLAAAKGDVAAHRKKSGAFVPPGPAIDATSLKGKSVWYIPVGAAVPVFQVEAHGIKQALAKLGMTYKTCDGKFLPAAAAACITQAVNAGAAGIIPDSVDPATVGTALAAAKEQGRSDRHCQRDRQGHVGAPVHHHG